MRRRHFIAATAAFMTPLARAQTQLEAIARHYERQTGGHIGIVATNVQTRRILVWRGDQRFVMCSTFKASLAAAVLHRCDLGQDDLDNTVHYTAAAIPDWYAPVAKAHAREGALSLRAACAGAVEQSDNTCANLLLARIGGPAALTAFWRGIGDHTSRLDNQEPELNRTPPGGIRNTTTPAAMTATIEKLALGQVLHSASRETFTGWLRNCQTGRHRLRAGFPPGWPIGDKTGNNGKDAAGDLAIAWPAAGGPIVISVYTRGGHPTEETFRRTFAAVARKVAKVLA